MADQPHSDISDWRDVPQGRAGHSDGISPRQGEPRVRRESQDDHGNGPAGAARSASTGRCRAADENAEEGSAIATAANGHGPARACWRAWVVVAITGMSVISCGGQGGRPGAMPADGTPASAAAICPDLVALRVALNDLILVRVGPAAGAEIGVRARDAGHRLDVLAAHTAGRWRIQVAALRSAIGVVRDAAARLAAHPDSASITAVTQSLQGASAAAEGLLAVITVDCPGSYPPGAALAGAHVRPSRVWAGE